MKRAFILALVAAMLASMLAMVVVGSPAQAANTAGEYLIDSNKDDTPDSRPFAGSDRYETALKLAKQYAGDLGTISTLILASGDTQIDAVAAAGLAGYEDAPVLLTHKNRLPAGVARFIDDQGVSQVYVTGGTAVISDAVIEQVEALEAAPEVTRLAGDNRYATAVEIAKRIESSQPWCDSNDTAALLVNGETAPYTSAVLAGPLSYQLEMPLLLTEADDLPQETSEYIDDSDNDLDRVVIIGDTDEVSEDVSETVEELGVDVTRIAGDDAAGTSVKIAELMWNDCDAVNTDKTTVLLANVDATVDGVAAGPVAGVGLNRDNMAIPILLVGSRLPASVRDWLAATPSMIDGVKTHLKIAAVGGTAVVSNSVMAAAVAAATSGGQLTAKLTVEDASKTGDETGDPTSFKVEFSESLGTFNSAKLKAYMERIVYVNNQRVRLADPESGSWGVADTPDCGKSSDFVVKLQNLKLKAGDKIELRPGDSPFGSAANAGTNSNDMRPLQPTSVTVKLKKTTTATTVTAVPTVELVAVEGETTLYVRPNLKHNELTRVDGKLSIKTRNGAKVTIEKIASESAIDAVSGAYGLGLTLTEAFDYNGDSDTSDTLEAAGQPYHLMVGDVVTAERGVLLNSAKKTSNMARATVTKRVPKFGVTSVVLGATDTEVNDDDSDDDEPGGKPTDRFQAKTDTGYGRGYVSRRPFVTFGALMDNIGTTLVPSYKKNEIVMFAKWSGVAAGARGNHWVVYTKFADRYDETKPVEIDVAMTTTGGVGKELGRITITFVNGKATNADVVAALRNNALVAKNFTVGYTGCTNGSVNVPDRAVGVKSDSNPWQNQAWYFYGGVSSVGIEVTFEDYISSLYADNEPNNLNSGDNFLGNRLRNSILKALVPGFETTTDNIQGGTRSLVNIVGSIDLTANHAFADPAGQNRSAAFVTFKAPSKTVHIRYTTQNPLRLASLRGGPDKGIITLAGSYYSTTGKQVVSTSHVAANYLLDGKSAQGPNDTVGSSLDPDELPDQIDDDSSGDALIGKTDDSEPIDFYNRAQTIRARTGTVKSYLGEYDHASTLDTDLSLGEKLGETGTSSEN